MADARTVAAVLAYLHELYPNRVISEATAEAWSITFADWPDDEFRECAKKAALEPGRTFFPTPGDIAAFRVTPVLDTAKLLRQISALGQYNPNGWIYPRIETVREQLGDTIANAYATAGAERCFADDGSVTQSVARTALAKELAAAVRRDGGQLLIGTPKTPDARILAAGDVHL